MVLIFLGQDGTCKFARRSTLAHREYIKQGYLPAASVRTIADADDLRTRLCKLTREPNSTTYRFPMAPTLDALEAAMVTFENAYLNGGFGGRGKGVDD